MFLAISSCLKQYLTPWRFVDSSTVASVPRFSRLYSVSIILSLAITRMLARSTFWVTEPSG
jgi:hypothetical protein